MPLANHLEAYETNTLNWHDGRGELSNGSWEGLPVIDFTPDGRDNYFYKASHTKRKVLLHYTLGFLGGDLSTLTQDEWHVSVAFLVARSGKIIRLFNPDYWSYHLGNGAKGGNEAMSKESVAIELSNIGQLEKSGNWMWNYVGDKYCRASETNHFIDLGYKYRNHRYYARFTTEQYAATKELLKRIVAKYGMQQKFLGSSARYIQFANSSAAQDYNGICSHVNFRPPTDKTDIGPAFDWGAIGANDDGAVVW